MQAKKTLICLTIATTFALVGCNKAEETASAVSSGANAVGSAVSETANQITNATADKDLTASQHQDAREDIMKQFGRTSKALRAMIENPDKFNADELKQHAQTLNQDPWVHFPETAKGGDAKDEIWTNPTEFQAEIDKYKEAVVALNTAAESATSIDMVKDQIAGVGASCKSCHTQFKAD
ncbi:cytochrome c, class II [Moraxella macacae 0408225]|uniref:Cytochrome c, class II n=1 Tax=Moraxella macacae 0408225 TaxID=1230338 RepID=L2F955_9GAMM|nr:cytochrome c [Moraxella macacae]ELA09552.1 cytochrome c, class II [Moraxella macacae 0408225]